MTPLKDTTPSSPANSEQATPQPTTSKRLTQNHDLLHYAAYFIGVSGLVFVAQTDAPKQVESAVIAGAIASTCVISRDWYKARLDPSMADDPTALIQLFNEMLHAGRAQANTNAAHLKRVEFLQTDLIEAMKSFNDLLRLNPDDIEQRLREMQSTPLGDAFSVVNVPHPPPINPAHNAVESPQPSTETHIPASTTVQQSYRARRPGFDA